MKKVAIVQSSYIPWKGYFDLIHAVDEFILLDSVQFTRRDWRNRNLIKSARGLRWLTIPVASKGKYLQRIDQTRVAGSGWARSHWAAIAQSYRDARYFRAYAGRIEALYATMKEPLISRINHAFLVELCDLLGIRTRIRRDTDYHLREGRTERLVALCRAAGADAYLSGPSARAYLDAEQFERAGIALEYMDYAGYPAYPQLHPPFEHGVSVIDLLFHAGPQAPSYIWGWREAHSNRSASTGLR
jgi:hypothetical protein